MDQPPTHLKWGLRGPHVLKGASDEQNNCSPHPPLQSQPGRTPTSPAPSPGLPGDQELHTARSQPGPPRGAGSKGRAVNQFCWRGTVPSPQAEVHTNPPVGLGLPVAQVDMAEQRPICQPQRLHSGLPGPCLSTPTQESSFVIDIRKWRLHECVKWGQ